MEFRDAITAYEEQPITRQLLLDLLKGYKRPFDKLDELVKQGRLVQVRRGIYILGPNLPIQGPGPLLLANHIYGPSYISLDTALSHWGLIPERVFETSSMTTNRAKIFRTPVGRFSYTHIATPYYSMGITQEKLTEKQTVLMASVEKALCDKIATTRGINFRSVKEIRLWLTEELRMDEQNLRNLDSNLINSWINVSPKKKILQLLVKTLQSL